MRVGGVRPVLLRWRPGPESGKGPRRWAEPARQAWPSQLPRGPGAARAQRAPPEAAALPLCMLQPEASSRASGACEPALLLPAPPSPLGRIRLCLTHFAAQAVIWRQQQRPELRGTGVVSDASKS